MSGVGCVLLGMKVSLVKNQQLAPALAVGYKPKANICMPMGICKLVFRQ